ncbi:MAG: mechanosensitive ion channel domain-containing protein [Halioglobus sp.]
METISWLLPELSRAQWLAHILIFLVNISLLMLARPILNLVESNRNNEAKVKIFNFLNILVLILHAVDLVLLRLSANYENAFVNAGMSLMSIYAGVFCYTLCCYLSRRRFGQEKEMDGKTIYLDTYSTRLVDLLLLLSIALTVIYSLIKIWGADSMLEATGIFGIFAALLAFTSSIWAPDIISGLIILNTEMLEDGDVVVVDGFPDEYIISKVTLVYVVLYDVRNNHRTLIRNSQFTQRKIDNLSRIASTDGVRQALKYNIGYPAVTASTREDRAVELEEFHGRIDRMFENAFEKCSDQKDIKINPKREFEWALTHAGDYALEYTLWVYLERIPNTKVTATIRRHLMGTLYKVNKAIFSSSVAEGIDLSTPTLTTMKLTQEKSASPEITAKYA